MHERTLRVRMMVLIAVVVATVFVWGPQLGGAELRADEKHLAVHFLDVGQGDATLIETPEGVQVLIDGGPDGSILRELGKVLAPNDRTIDVVIGTHPDSDHVAGLADVLERYHASLIIDSAHESDSPAATHYREKVAAEGAKRVEAQRGQQLRLGASTTLRVLFPDVDAAELDSNAASTVLQLQHGDTKFLFTGDAPARIEQYLVRLEKSELASDVLKVGHHGSDTSTNAEFVSAVDPQWAVISAGADNSYGHPHADVLETLSDIETLGTYDQGTLTFSSDGAEVWREE